MSAAKTKPSILLAPTYLRLIRASVNSGIFQTLYVQIGNKQVDILENGNLSCAFFVSSILKLFSLIKDTHATVSGTERDLARSGWQRIKKPQIGCVIIYAPTKFPDGSIHRHIGFFIGRNKAISNNYRTRVPSRHIWNKRPVESLWWHEKLNKHYI